MIKRVAKGVNVRVRNWSLIFIHINYRNANSIYINRSVEHPIFAFFLNHRII